MWLHERNPIPGGNQLTLGVCAASGIVASLVPGLKAADHIEVVMLVPVAFFATYAVARLVLPLLGGASELGRLLMTALFYGSFGGGLMGLLYAIPGVGLQEFALPGDRAYQLATSLPAGCGLAVAALQRLRAIAAPASD